MKGKYMAKNWQDALDDVQEAAGNAADRVPWQQIEPRHHNGRQIKVVEVLEVPVGKGSYTIKYYLGTDGVIHQGIAEIGLRRSSLTSFNMETLLALQNALEAIYPEE